MSESRQQASNRPARIQQVPEPVCISAPVVSGIGETEVLERIVLDVVALGTAAISAGVLPPDFVGNVIEAVVLSKRVSITECDVFTNKVLVNGVLHKDLVFKAAPADQPDTTGILLTADDCTLILTQLLDVVIDCPFGACIPVPGACPGDQCLVETACVEAEKELLIDTDGDGLADQFEEKVCILIQVKTIRNQQVTVTPVENLCPQFTPVPTCPATSCLTGTQAGLPSSTLISRVPASGGV